MEELTSDIQKVLKPAAVFSQLNSELFNTFPGLNQPLSCHVEDYVSINNILNNAINTNQPNEQLPFHNKLFCTNDETHATASQSSTGFGSGGGNKRIVKNKSAAGKKRKRKGGEDKEEEVEKPKEVIHVRAKRGQATDSHSLAERVRRERINDKLKLLQDLVPGCYKTMGMAVMLDVIINYVQSLQNQIEFLSMKLSAASMFYDFNSPEAEVIENLQRLTTTNLNCCDTQEIERAAREGQGGMLPRSWPF